MESTRITLDKDNPWQVAAEQSGISLVSDGASAFITWDVVERIVKVWKERIKERE